MKKSWQLVIAGLALTAPSLVWAQAAQYPTKTINMIVGFAAGGPTDVVARLIGTHLSRQFNGTAVTVDNRPGGAGVIAPQAVMQSAPDGYTIMFGSSSLTNNPRLMDFALKMTPVTMIVAGNYVLEVAINVPANSVKELLDLARKQPGVLNYASPGTGSTSHLAGELFKLRTGVNLTHVPYKGSAPALQDLVAGRVQVMFDAIPSSQAFIESGKLRALAVTSPRRDKSLPNTPSSEEAGLTNFNLTYWFGVMGPPAMPSAITQRLNTAFVTILKDPQVRTTLESQGTSPVGDTPAEFGAKLKTEIDTWRNVIETSKIQLD